MVQNKNRVSRYLSEVANVYYKSLSSTCFWWRHIGPGLRIDSSRTGATRLGWWSVLAPRRTKDQVDASAMRRRSSYGSIQIHRARHFQSGCVKRFSSAARSERHVDTLEVRMRSSWDCIYMGDVSPCKSGLRVGRALVRIV